MKPVPLTVTALVLLCGAGARDIYPQLGAFARALALIEQTYIERIAPETLVEHAITGMVKNLDKYSEYIPPATYKTLRGESAQSVGHVGIELREEAHRLLIAGLLPDGPALRSGLRVGDVVSQIDGVKQPALAAAGRALHGTPGTKTTLLVERAGFVSARKFTLERESLPDISVSVSRHLAWVVAQVRRFPDRSAKMFEDGIKAELARGGVAGVLIDLRGNPGGLIVEAVKMLDLFIAKGTLLVIIGREGKELERYRASGKKGTWTMPVVVLIDAHSASAAEIVAGAMQDTGRAKIYGEKSFGKGSVQNIVELEDGSALRLTTALYFTPTLKKVEGKGISPDVPLSGAPETWVDAAIVPR